MTHSATRVLDPAREAEGLVRTSRIGRTIHSFQSVTSTNTLAADWAEDGAPDGAVVYAEHQTQGRGRHGRTWQAHAGLNLTFSIILRPTLPIDRLGMIPIAAGLAVAEALDGFVSPISADIKWPNDILLCGRNCGGILLESRWIGGEKVPAVVLGIGINVNQTEFPPELSDRATSLLLETGRRTQRAPLFALILERLEQRLDSLPGRAAEVRRSYLDRMTQLNSEVSLRFSSGDSVCGVAIGLDDFGGIVLESSGTRRVFHSGEVSGSI
jgi:BirA family biotin operon repressor/biotin-[acetyl-CoA-carboxylase] ligase